MHTLKERRQPPETQKFDLTIPWLPFLAPTQRRFSLTYLPQASTSGRGPPQPVPPLGHTPSRPSSFRLTEAIFEPNLSLYKYPNSLILEILSAYTAIEDGTECSETSAHKIQIPGNRPKEGKQSHFYLQRIEPTFILFVLTAVDGLCILCC